MEQSILNVVGNMKMKAKGAHKQGYIGINMLRTKNAGTCVYVSIHAYVYRHVNVQSTPRTYIHVVDESMCTQ